MDPHDTHTATSAALAKATLRRLALHRLEPTPENYARAWAEEAGTEPHAAGPAATGMQASPQPGASAATHAAEVRAQGVAWAGLIERLAACLDRGGRQWTAARRKDSLHRVLQGSRSDSERLLHRLQALVQAWQSDKPLESAELSDMVHDGPPPPPVTMPAPLDEAPMVRPQGGAALTFGHDDREARRTTGALADALQSGLPRGDNRAVALANRLAVLADRLAASGATAELAAEAESLSLQAQRWFGHRHQLVDQLAGLCRELTQGLTELAEDESWARGQCASVQARLGEGLSLRTVRAAAELLGEAREHQRRLRDDRTAAREALKHLLASMLDEVGQLGEHTGVFEQAVQRHEAAIAKADSVDGLAGIVQAMLEDSRAVRTAVGSSQARLQEQQERAGELEARVRALETELRRISDEAATDALTQVANRRGLEQAFAAEITRGERAGDLRLAVGLIDIDNFKKLNDRLGHTVGDVALKSLAAAVRERLRPVDRMARFGGEEFVLLLPDTDADEGQVVLTRLQRSLTASLFLHEGEEVFVTFSAGVTAWRAGETLEAALSRADEALYEAKRTGKNRTCKA